MGIVGTSHAPVNRELLEVESKTTSGLCIQSRGWVERRWRGTFCFTASNQYFYGVIICGYMEVVESLLSKCKVQSTPHTKKLKLIACMETICSFSCQHLNIWQPQAHISVGSNLVILTAIYLESLKIANDI